MSLYITTAIPFVNARPHLGFALELCIADAIARHARARGADVQLISGTDDHSLKNVLAAERAGRTTTEYVSEQAQLFRQLAAALERFQRSSDSDAPARTDTHLLFGEIERLRAENDALRAAYDRSNAWKQWRVMRPARFVYRRFCLDRIGHRRRGELHRVRQRPGAQALVLEEKAGKLRTQ